MAVPPRLSVCTFLASEIPAASIETYLEDKRYAIAHLQDEAELLGLATEDPPHPDCTILAWNSNLSDLVGQLRDRGILLPTVIVGYPDSSVAPPSPVYHAAEVRVPVEAIDNLGNFVEKAIEQFLNLAPAEVAATAASDSQQTRLIQKLRERLGYLGVYYKRNPQYFIRNLPPDERGEFLDRLRELYREIILSYFSRDSTSNQQIDEFVSLAFFADISVTRIVEIHMELMDEFSKQLKLEGRNEDILLDYRLTLIDVIAHLCEMYRRSIPRHT